MIRWLKRLFKRDTPELTIDDVFTMINEFRRNGWALPDGIIMKTKPNEFEPMLFWLDDIYYHGDLVATAQQSYGKLIILEFHGGKWVDLLISTYNHNIKYQSFMIHPPVNNGDGYR
jgi:hypothetical protein